MEQKHKNNRKKPWWKTSFGMVCTGIFLIALFFLIKDHTAHIGNYWIWLILLACPLMHIFMHSHHSHNSTTKENDDDSQK